VRLLLAATLAFGITATGCSKHTSLGQAPEGAEDDDDDDKGKKGGKQVLSSKKILQKGGLCKDERVVDDPEEGTDEWVIFRMYQLALGKDSPAALDAFAKLYPSKRKRELKEMYWPRIRKNVHKFMNEPGEPAFTICRVQKTDRGLKYYIKTSDPKQHPPPITIGEVDGEQRIVFLTPF